MNGRAAVQVLPSVASPLNSCGIGAEPVRDESIQQRNGAAHLGAMEYDNGIGITVVNCTATASTADDDDAGVTWCEGTNVP